MCDYISLKTGHLEDNSGQERIQACQMEKIQVQKKCVNVVFMMLMLSKTVLQADKWKPQTSVHSFFLYRPIPQMANVTKKLEGLKKKYISCTQNVQPMFCDRK